ncbi:MAG TPA: hypothetical protein P5543_05130 [Planctomycetota bacterium]|nr:hypothetical protein [Planctomycetota bacterium]
MHEEIKVIFVGFFHFTESFGLDVEFTLNNLEPQKDCDGNLYRFHAEHIQIRESSIKEEKKYDIIIDRGSCFFPYAIDIVPRMCFQSTYFVNNPWSFQYFLNNKYAGYGMAHDIGISVPKTYILPAKTHSMVLSQSHLFYHEFFDWKKIVTDIGFPCFIKPANGKGGMGVRKIYDLQGLIAEYDKSDKEILLVQSYVHSPHNWQVRCLCIGRQIIPIKYQFKKNDNAVYIQDDNFLTEEQYQEIINISQVLNRLLGYEMNAVEFIIDEQGKPWAIDFNNPVPDARRAVLTDYYYTKYKNALIQRIQEIASEHIPPNFIPNLEPYFAIAQLPISRQEKFERALQEARKYFGNACSTK